VPINVKPRCFAVAPSLPNPIVAGASPLIDR
jgi:hypothetical protein